MPSLSKAGALVACLLLALTISADALAAKPLKTLSVSEGRSAVRDYAEDICSRTSGSDPCESIAMGSCKRGTSRVKVDCTYKTRRESGSNCTIQATAKRTRSKGVTVRLADQQFACRKKFTDVDIG